MTMGVITQKRIALAAILVVVSFNTAQGLQVVNGKVEESAPRSLHVDEAVTDEDAEVDLHEEANTGRSATAVESEVYSEEKHDPFTIQEVDILRDTRRQINLPFLPQPKGKAQHCAFRDTSMVLVMFIAVILYSQNHERIAASVGLRLSHVCCIAYASLSVAIDISIKNAAQGYGGNFPFNPACAVIVVEVLKLLASVFLFIAYLARAKKNQEIIAMPTWADVRWLSVPAFIYAGNNMLVFQAIRATPMATFGVIRETMLIWNVILWSVTFKTTVSIPRCVAIFGIFLGCTINQVPVMLDSKFTWGVGWALLLAFTTALGAVANEYAMKQRACLDINLQNCILYSMCGSLTVIGLVTTDIQKVESFDAFFKGFVPECWQVIILQVITGLAVSRILKYVEAVTKTIVAALRGPGVIFVGALVFSSQLKWTEVMATFIVCASSYAYLSQGPLQEPPLVPSEKEPGNAQASVEANAKTPMEKLKNER